MKLFSNISVFVNKRKFSILFIVTGLALILPIIPYKKIFNGSYSTLANEWSDFGSYFGGITGPLLSFITIIFLVYSFNEELKNTRLTDFDRQFFTLLDLKQETVENFIINTTGKKGSEAIKELFMWCKNLSSLEALSILEIPLKDPPTSDPTKSEYITYHYNLGFYRQYRNQFNLLKMNSPSVSRLMRLINLILSKLDNMKAEITYYEILLNSLTDIEMKILFYGGLVSPIKIIGYDRVKIFINDYYHLYDDIQLFIEEQTRFARNIKLISTNVEPSLEKLAAISPKIK